MKKTFLMWLGCMFISVASLAQKTTPPAAVSNAFNAKFPGAKEIKWSKENAKEYEAEFKLNNTTVAANFAIDGSWKVTETVIAVTDLPASVVSGIKAKYPTAVISSAEKVEAPGKVFYEPTIIINGKKKIVEISGDGQSM